MNNMKLFEEKEYNDMFKKIGENKKVLKFTENGENGFLIQSGNSMPLMKTNKFTTIMDLLKMCSESDENGKWHLVKNSYNKMNNKKLEYKGEPIVDYVYEEYRKIRFNGFNGEVVNSFAIVRIFYGTVLRYRESIVIDVIENYYKKDMKEIVEHFNKY